MENDTQQVTANQSSSVSWTASEYIEHKKPAAWYLILLLGAVFVCGLAFLITREIIIVITLAVVALSFGYFAGRPPMMKRYDLTADTLYIDRQPHLLSLFRSFSLVDEGQLRSIWLKPIKRFRPMLIVYINPADEEAIVEALSQRLPIEPRELDAVDRFANRMRF